MENFIKYKLSIREKLLTKYDVIGCPLMECNFDVMEYHI